MKLSTLNKYKGKEVFVSYRDPDDGAVQHKKGTIEDINPEQITIVYETGFANIPPNNIISVDLGGVVRRVD